MKHRTFSALTAVVLSSALPLGLRGQSLPPGVTERDITRSREGRFHFPGR